VLQAEVAFDATVHEDVLEGSPVQQASLRVRAAKRIMRAAHLHEHNEKACQDAGLLAWNNLLVSANCISMAIGEGI
jgi:hypothetical protein